MGEIDCVWLCISTFSLLLSVYQRFWSSCLSPNTPTITPGHTRYLTNQLTLKKSSPISVCHIISFISACVCQYYNYFYLHICLTPIVDLKIHQRRDHVHCTLVYLCVLNIYQSEEHRSDNEYLLNEQKNEGIHEATQFLFKVLICYRTAKHSGDIHGVRCFLA